MCFDNNNCSCIWLIVILLLVFCCCGSGTRIPLRLRQWRRRLLLLLRAVHTFARRGRAGVPSLFYALQQVPEPLHDLPVDVVHGADLSVPGAVNAGPPAVVHHHGGALPAGPQVCLVPLVDVGGGVGQLLRRRIICSDSSVGTSRYSTRPAPAAPASGIQSQTANPETPAAPEAAAWRSGARRCWWCTGRR